MPVSAMWIGMLLPVESLFHLALNVDLCSVFCLHFVGLSRGRSGLLHDRRGGLSPRLRLQHLRRITPLEWLEWQVG